MKSKRALLLVDLQNDFMPTGSLPVPHGDAVVAIANRLQPQFDLVVASQDWHPANHGSFAVNHPEKEIGEFIQLNGVNQILWPAHCVQSTRGAEFVSSLKTEKITRVFKKGTDPLVDSYSSFFDNAHLRNTGLGDYLKQNFVTDLYVLGLATDYCVKFSVLDGIELGFKIFVVMDGCRAVNLSPGDGDKAFEEMKEAGATMIQSQELL